MTFIIDQRHVINVTSSESSNFLKTESKCSLDAEQVIFEEIHFQHFVVRYYRHKNMYLFQENVMICWRNLKGLRNHHIKCLKPCKIFSTSLLLACDTPMGRYKRSKASRLDSFNSNSGEHSHKKQKVDHPPKGRSASILSHDSDQKW